MEKVKCPKCGKEEKYKENSAQICWDCNQYMTLKGFPKPTLDIAKFWHEQALRKLEGETWQIKN